MCYRNDLLSLKSAHLPRDLLEARFFGAIDHAGASARDRLLALGPGALTSQDRSDFARLLFSLEVRRPVLVQKLRDETTRCLAATLDGDPEVQRAFELAGIGTAPSAYHEANSGVLLEDQAMLMAQRLVDACDVGRVLINATWEVPRLPDGAGLFILGDRPLIRLNGFDQPGAAWFLPLAPDALFVAVNQASNLGELRKVSRSQLRKKTNLTTVQQADVYVFAANDEDPVWMRRHFRAATSLRST